jgi:hypothetical protein
VQLSIPFRRKPAPEEAPEQVEVAVAGGPRARTASKREQGRATPARKVTGRRVEAPPKDRKEAVKRAREKEKEFRDKQRAARSEARAGMLEGKEEFLPARDKGPERALVRNIVDSRRNIGGLFIPAAVVVLLTTSGLLPSQAIYLVNILWAVLAVAVIVDSYLLSRKVRSQLLARFPKSPKQPRSYYFYAIMRSLTIRRLRMPVAKVKPGQAV